MQPTPGGISLRNILPQARYSRSGHYVFSACCSDSRNVRPGDLFVALVGSHEDGHTHIAEAVERGATAVLTERFVSSPVPLCIVPDTREAYGHICQVLAGNPCDKLFLVGVSGTQGKTATSMLLASIFKEAQLSTGIISSLGISDSLQVRDATDFMWRPPEMARTLSEFSANGCSHAIVEIPSQALAYRTTAGLLLDAAVMTNIRSDHLDIHGTVENYRRAQRRLFAHTKAAGYVVLNTDDAGNHASLASLNQPTLTTAIKDDAQLTATVIDRCASEQTFLIHAGHQSIPVRTQITGNAHIQHCLQATATGLAAGLELPLIVRGLEALDAIPGYLDRIECGQPFRVFIDGARTADQLSRTLQTIRQVTPGRLICVMGPTALDDPRQRPLLGRAAQQHSDTMIITSNNPAYEQPLQIIHDVLDGCADPDRPLVCPDRARAIHAALDRATANDTVIITGKGHVTHQQIEHRILPFDDRQVACEWLYNEASHRNDSSKDRSLEESLFHLN
jgi:UDP-N-acetylmuramoyl-L-alanyl-D-glutamate--2,6-diaminopimelate ligase